MSDNRSCPARGLHTRTSAGLQVGPCQSPVDGPTWVAVRDARRNAAVVLPVLAGERARDVFDHPYAHAARRGVPTIARAA